MEDMAVEVAKLQQRQSVSEHRISDPEGAAANHGRCPSQQQSRQSQNRCQRAEK